MSRVFISFVHEDRSIAETVKRILEQQLNLVGHVFIVTDQQQLRAGDDWLQRIREELTSAEIVLLMISKRAITMPWVNFEAGAAWLSNKRLISACFGNQRKGNLPKPYSNWQAVQLPDDEEYLLDSIANWLKIERPGGRFLERLQKVLEPERKKDGIDMLLDMMVDLRLALKNWRDEP
jgi:hypothetical protein